MVEIAVSALWPVKMYRALLHSVSLRPSVVRIAYGLPFGSPDFRLSRFVPEAADIWSSAQ